MNFIKYFNYFDFPTAESPSKINFKSLFCLKNSSSLNSFVVCIFLFDDNKINLIGLIKCY